MAEISSVGMAVLIGGIALFILILTLFIVWKVKFENRPARPRRPSPSSNPTGSRSRQDHPVPALTIADPRDSTLSSDSATGMNQRSDLDTNSDSNSNNNKPGGQNYCNVPNADISNNSTPMTTFGSKAQGPPLSTLPTAPPIHEAEDRYSSAHPEVKVNSATRQNVYSHLGDKNTTKNNTDEYDTSALAKQSNSAQPGTYSVAHEPGSFTVAHEPGSYSVAHEPGSFTVAHEPGSYSVAHEPGSNSTQSQQNAPGDYFLASAVGAAEDNNDVEIQRETSGGIRPGSGDYFQLEPMKSPVSESSASENYFVLEKQGGEEATRAGEANVDNVYVQLEDEL